MILVIYQDFEDLPSLFCISESSPLFRSHDWIEADGLIVNSNDSQYSEESLGLICDLSLAVSQNQNPQFSVGSEDLSVLSEEEVAFLRACEVSANQLLNAEFSRVVLCGFAP